MSIVVEPSASDCLFRDSSGVREPLPDLSNKSGERLNCWKLSPDFGDFAGAVDVAEAGLKQAPENKYFLSCSAYFSILGGDLAWAEQRLAEGLRLWPDEPLFIGSQGLLHARRGENALALECVRRALDSPRSFGHTHHVHNQIAGIYAAMGETDKAMGWLERTADTGCPCWPFFLADPFLESLRDKVEFKRLIDDLRRTYTAFKIQRL